MTMESDTSRESLRFRLLGGKEDLVSWGQEYIRHMTGELAQEYDVRTEKNASVDELYFLFNYFNNIFLGFHLLIL